LCTQGSERMTKH